MTDQLSMIQGHDHFLSGDCVTQQVLKSIAALQAEADSLVGTGGRALAPWSRWKSTPGIGTAGFVRLGTTSISLGRHGLTLPAMLPTGERRHLVCLYPSSWHFEARRYFTGLAVRHMAAFGGCRVFTGVADTDTQGPIAEYVNTWPIRLSRLREFGAARMQQRFAEKRLFIASGLTASPATQPGDIHIEADIARQLADFVECLDRDAIAILGIQSRDGRVHPSLKALLEIPACEVLTPMSGQPNRSEPRWHLASVTGWLHLELAASHLVLLETPTDIDLEMFHWELAHR